MNKAKPLSQLYPMRCLLPSLLLVGACLFDLNPACAANGTWTNLVSGGLWSNTANWSGGTIADGSGSTADFSTLNLTANNVVVFDAPHTLTTLIFGDTTSTYYNWTLNNNNTAANVLTLAGTSPSITVNTGIFTNNVVIAGTAGFSLAGSSTAASTLYLGASNTFTGNVSINAGTGGNFLVYLNNAGALGGNASTSVLSLAANSATRAELELNASGFGIYSNILIMSPPAASSSSRVEVHVSAANSTNTWDGNIVLNGISGSASPLADFYCDGSGSLLTLNGNISTSNNFSGQMSLRGAYTGIINGSINMPNAVLDKNDGGTWLLNNANNAWTNGIIGYGTLKLGVANALPSSAGLTFGGGSGTAVLDLNGFAQAFGTNVVQSGSNPNRITNSVSGGAFAPLTFNNASNSSCGVIISGRISLIKSGAGVLTLTAANTYTGNTVVSNGTLAVSSAGTLANSTNIIIASGATLSPTGMALGASQKLLPVDLTSVIGGNVTLGSGQLVLNYSVANPALTVSGSLVFGANTVVTVNGAGGLLAAGQMYLLVATSNSGSISGTMPNSVQLTGVTGLAGSLSVSNSSLYLVMGNKPLVASQSPVPYTNVLTLFAGASPKFSVTAGGVAPFAYAWVTNGVLDGAATNAGMTWPNVQPTALTAYCIITNSYGSATSAVWSASVITAPTQPYPAAVMSSNLIGYWRLNEPDDQAGNYNDGVIALDYWGGKNGIYTNTELGLTGYSQNTDPNTTAALFGIAASQNSEAYGITGLDFGSPTNTSVTFTVDAWVNGAVPTLDAGIVTVGYGGGGEQFDLDTGGTSHAFRFLVRDAAGAVHSASSSIIADGSTWHHLVGTCDEPHGKVTLYVDGQAAATAAIVTNSGILGATSLMSIGARYSSSAALATNNYDYQFQGYINDVAIYSSALSSNQVMSQYLAAGIAPFITVQPVSSTNVFANGPLFLSAAASGTPPLSYSWFDGNANSYIPGQTNATLALTGLTSGDEYYLTVSNLYGSVNSDTVAVFVDSGLNASLTPNLNLSVYAGQAISYSANATGNYPIYYQWSVNGVAVPAATNGVYNLPAPLGSNSVSCLVSNNYNGYSSLVLGPVELVGVTAPTNLYQVTILSNKPVAYWPLNEADDGLGDGNAADLACDYVGGHNCAYNNVNLGLAGFNAAEYPDLTAPLFGILAPTNSLALENDYSASGIPNINFSQPTGADAVVSVEAWVNLTNADSAANIVSKGCGHSEQFGLDLYNSGFRFVFRDATGTSRDTGVSAAATVGKWYHVVGVWDGPNGAGRLYVNGVYAAGNTGLATGLGLWTPAVNANLTDANLVNIGSEASSIATNVFDVQFPGQIANVAIYGYPLSTNQIQADYFSGTNVPSVTPPAPGTLILTNLSGGQVQLIWNFTGTLQNATNVAGPYNSETNAVSPYTVPATNAQMFYRILQQ